MRDNLIFASICCIKQCFKNIDVKNVTEKQKVFRKLLDYFQINVNTIILIEKDKILQGDKVNANTFIVAGKAGGTRWEGGHALPTFWQRGLSIKTK